MVGPRLDEKAFFEAMDLSRSELRDVKQAVEAGNWAGARKAFAGHIRTRGNPKWFSDWKNRSEPMDRDAEVELVRVGDRAVKEVDLAFADQIMANHLISCRVAQEFGEEI
ncbi:MAG: hypothetical protein O3B73_16845, partial [bacterium]|nr:hypothetical protein [bacterium]